MKKMELVKLAEKIRNEAVLERMGEGRILLNLMGGWGVVWAIG